MRLFFCDFFCENHIFFFYFCKRCGIIYLSVLSGQKIPLLLLVMEVFMKLVLEKLKIDLQEKLDSEEIIVDDVTFEEKGKYHFLTVTLDKIGGIDLETIVDATKIVNEVVDKADITDDSYILDVVSKERGE